MHNITIYKNKSETWIWSWTRKGQE